MRRSIEGRIRLSHIDGASKLKTQPAFDLGKLLRERQLLDGGYVPCTRATLWRWVASGRFPRPIKLSGGVTAWREQDVMAWQRSLAQGVATK